MPETKPLREPAGDSPDRSQLPFLLRLLDDPSPRVRERVSEQLRRFGSELEQAVAEAESSGATVPDEGRAVLASIVSEIEREGAWAGGSWLSWMGEPDPHVRLEKALSALSAWQHEGPGRARSLSDLLDDLAEDFEASGREPSADELCLWLFGEKRLRGSADDYYNPRNSSLIEVIESGQGIPISLACVFILVGRRLGLQIEGCAFPGHFLAVATAQGRTLLFDCFNGTRLSAAESAAVRRAGPHLLAAPPTPEEIVERTLNNLIAAFTQQDERDRARAAHDLLRELREAVEERGQ